MASLLTIESRRCLIRRGNSGWMNTWREARNLFTPFLFSPRLLLLESLRQSNGRELLYRLPWQLLFLALPRLELAVGFRTQAVTSGIGSFGSSLRHLRARRMST